MTRTDTWLRWARLVAALPFFLASLVGFPQALAMMGEKPDWVQNVGDELLPLIAGVGIAGAGVERSADLLPEAQATLAELRSAHASIGAASQ
jgi:hypothetical protein